VKIHTNVCVFSSSPDSIVGPYTVGNQCIADLGISEVGKPVPQVSAVAEPKESDSRNGFLSDCSAGHPPPRSANPSPLCHSGAYAGRQDGLY